MQDRKLASIQKILNITPIPDAKYIECARILGWDVVVQKNQFKINDLCVYIQIDSVLPDKPEFEFMRSKKFRVRTIRLRKQISQGIAFPLDILKNEDNKINQNMIKVDVDVTKHLGIKQWEPWKKPVRLYQKEYVDLTLWQKIKEKIFNIKVRRIKKKWGFPTYLVPQTTETRIQNSPSILRGYKGDLISITEKLDGTSATYLIHKKRFIVCSRALIRRKNDDPKYPYLPIAKKYDIENKLKNIGSYAIQGEIIGPNIENGTGIDYGFKEIKFYIFNIYDIKAQRYVDSYKFNMLCKKLKMYKVPDLGIHKLSGTIEEILELSHGESKLNKNFLREGIVVRSRNISDRRWDFSFKCVDPLFELKYGKPKKIHKKKLDKK